MGNQTWDGEFHDSAMQACIKELAISVRRGSRAFRWWNQRRQLQSQRDRIMLSVGKEAEWPGPNGQDSDMGLRT